MASRAGPIGLPLPAPRRAPRAPLGGGRQHRSRARARAPQHRSRGRREDDEDRHHPQGPDGNADPSTPPRDARRGRRARTGDRAARRSAPLTIVRTMLDKAGVTRDELHANDATRKGLTWYDLRATGITWMAIRGDDPLKIMSRAGHVDFKTTQGYIREAEAVRAGFGDVFPPLPATVLRALDSTDEALPPRDGEDTECPSEACHEEDERCPPAGSVSPGICLSASQVCEIVV